ncbi:hypothetical protein [uncultured Nostoc sp.]|uniref:hypothetical protein n=1 Tax=uncultured Nostoc sp. TaxID=340711 RepID=UPI0035CBE96C|nr:hypothetical protein [Nostoc sp. JL33]
MLNLTQATTVQTEYVFLISTKYLTIWRTGEWGVGSGAWGMGHWAIQCKDFGLTIAPRRASPRTPAEDKLRAASVCDTLRERRERLLD